MIEDGEAAPVGENGIRHHVLSEAVVTATGMHQASVYLMLGGSRLRNEVGTGTVRDGEVPKTKPGTLQHLGFHVGRARRTTVFLVST